MGYDYRQKLKAEGQQHSNACWAAAISWWTAAMSLHFKRTTYTQTDLLADHQQNVVLGGGVTPSGLRNVVESAKIRMELKFIQPTELPKYSMDTPCIIIYHYPEAGGTHMNVIFDRQGDTVMCMEPFFPLVAAADGTRKGMYTRRPLSFFKGKPEIGIGYLPVKESMNGTTASY